MKKLNNKGFSVVELTISFLVVFMIAFAMYDLLFNYRDKETEESIEKDLKSYTNQIILAIQNDISERKLKLIDECYIKATETKSNCIDLQFNDGTNKWLYVDKEEKKYEDTGDQNFNVPYISYGNIKYESSEARLLEVKIRYMLYEYPRIGDTVGAEDFGLNTHIYKISIPIYHNDLEGDFGIEVIAVAYDYEYVTP